MLHKNKKLYKYIVSVSTYIHTVISVDDLAFRELRLELGFVD